MTTWSSANIPIFFSFVVLLLSEYYFITWQALRITDTNLWNRTNDYWVRVECYESEKGGKLPESDRNCWFGERDVCSEEYPCAPCDAAGMTLYQKDFLGDFANGSTSVLDAVKKKFKYLGTCRNCTDFGSGSENSNCKFVDGVGPYCKIPVFKTFGTVSSYEWVTKPCEKCCTDFNVHPTFDVSGGLRYEEIDPIPPGATISPNVTSHVVSVTVTLDIASFFAADLIASLGVSLPQVNVYYTIDTVEDPSPYLQNGFWYDTTNPPVITKSGNTTIKAIGIYFYKGKMFKSESISSKTYSIVTCEQDLYFVYMSSSYVDPTWVGGLATDALSSSHVFSHDDVRNPTLLLKDSNTTTTGVGTYSITTTGSVSQYIAVSFPSYVRVSRVRLSPLHIDRWDANDLNGRSLQFSRDPCVSSGTLLQTGWETLTIIENITDSGTLTEYVLNATMANTSVSCWRVYSPSGFVGLGSFVFDSTCAEE